MSLRAAMRASLEETSTSPSPAPAPSPAKKKAPAKKPAAKKKAAPAKKKGPTKKPAAAKKRATKSNKMVLESDDDEVSDIDFSDENEDEAFSATLPVAPSVEPKKSVEVNIDNFDDVSSDDLKSDLSDTDESSSDEEEMDFSTPSGNDLANTLDYGERAKLDAMNELERENYLANLHETMLQQNELKKIKYQMEREEKANKRAEKKGKKKLVAKKKPAKRASTRNKDVSNAKKNKESAQADLRRRKQASKSALDNVDSDDSDMFDDSDDEDSDDDFGGVGERGKRGKNRRRGGRLDDSDADDSGDDRAERKKINEKDLPPATFEEYIPIVIPRSKLQKWANEPYFSTAVKGCYVKYSIGVDKATGKRCYRLCKVEGVEKFPNYYSFSQNDSGAKTNRRLVISFGNDKRTVKMDMVSNSAIAEADVDRLNQFLKTTRPLMLPLTSKRAQKLARTKMGVVANNFVYTSEVVKRAIEEKKAMEPGTVSNIGLETGNLELQILGIQEQIADHKRDMRRLAVQHPILETGEKEARIEDCIENDVPSTIRESYETSETAIEGLVPRLEILQKELDRVNKAGQRRDAKFKAKDGWGKINSRAIEYNQSVDYSFKESPSKKKGASTTALGATYNPFKRRPNKPHVLWNVGSKANASEGDVTAPPKEDAPEVPAENDNDNDDAMDGGTDENAMINDSVVIDSIDTDSKANTNGNANGAVEKRNRTGLSLADYLARKGR